MRPRNIALTAKEAALDKKAEDPVILDIKKLTNVAQYFVIVHGNSDRHVRAIAQGISDVMEENKIKRWHIEGMDSGQWVLLDYASVIIHVFYRGVREFYGLERLWGEAPRL